MDDWKLKARVVVKLKREANMFVSLYFVSCFISYLTISQILILTVAVVISVTCFCVWDDWRL